MTIPDIYAELTSVFRDVFDDDTLTIAPETTAADVPNWDSRAHVALIVATEMRFGIRFRASEFGKLANVGEFVSLIARKLATA